MFVTNCISTTKIQKISEITNFFRHYFLSRTEVLLKMITQYFFFFNRVSKKTLYLCTGFMQDKQF